MVKFLREKSKIVVWVIVVCFGLTMFAGSVFLGGFGANEKGAKKINEPSKIAQLGEVNIAEKQYINTLSRYFYQVEQENKTILTPELVELIQYNVLISLIQNTALKAGANEQNIKVTKKELEQNIMLILHELDLKNKKQLKKYLKEQKTPYKSFVNSLKEDVRLQKFVAMIESQVNVTEKDLENQFVKIKARHILISKKEGQTKEEVLQKANDIYTELRKGMKFQVAVKQYSDDIQTKDKGGDLGWVKANQTMLNFERVAFSLEIGELSRPVETLLGVHIIQLTDKSKLPKSRDYDEKEAKKQLIQLKKKEAIDQYVQSFLIKNPLTVKEPSLLAYQSKVRGDIQSAINAYQTQVSQDPYSPYPHYFIGKIYMMLDQWGLAEESFNKADIKVSLREKQDFPQLYLLLGDIYLKQKKKSKALTQFKKALEQADHNKGVLTELKERFGQLKDQKSIQKIKVILKSLE